MIDDSLRELKEVQKNLKGSKNPHDIEAYRNADAMIKSLTDRRKKLLSASPKFASLLDNIADRLESKGLLKEAHDLDIISNTLEVMAAEPMIPGQQTGGSRIMIV